MKLIIVFGVLAVTVARAVGLDKYDKYDNLDVDEVIGNERLLKAHSHCIIGDGSCTKEGQEFKDLAPDVIETSCAKCSDKLKNLMGKLIKAVQTKLPEEYTKLKQKYDPDNKRDDELKEYLAKYGA